MSIYNHVDASLWQPSRTSREGEALLHEFEGFRHEAYLCPANVWTIGYGNTRYEDGSPVRKGDRITKERGVALFRNILAGFEAKVKKLVKVELTQGQFDALVSFAYNVGVDALRKSTLLRKLNAGDYSGAADEFLRWNKGGGRVLNGLTRRREAERELFKS